MVIQRSGVADKNLGTRRKGELPTPPTVEMICAAIQAGMELGMGPMQSVYAFAAVRGKSLSILGDAARALVENSEACEWIKDNQDELSMCGKLTDDVTGWVESKRKDRPEPVRRSFSVAQAKTARLWGQEGPWSTYAARMLYYRPLGFLCRDLYGDILRGLRILEEERDIPEVNGLPNGATIGPEGLDGVVEEMEEKGQPPIDVVTPNPEESEEAVQKSFLEDQAADQAACRDS